MARTSKSSYVSRMVVLRCMIVGLLALALSVGPGWQSCAAIQENFASPTASPANPTDLHRNQEHHQHAMMGTDALGNQAMAEAAKGQPESKHACIMLRCLHADKRHSRMPRIDTGSDDHSRYICLIN